MTGEREAWTSAKEVLPLGLVVAAGLVVVRSAGAVAGRSRVILEPTERTLEMLRWDVARRFPSIAVGGLVLGVLAAVVARRAMAPGAKVATPRPVLLLFAAAILLAGLSGWPFAPAHLTAGFHGSFGPDDLAVLVPLALGVAVVLFAVSAAARRASSIRHLVEGGPALAVAVVVALAPTALAWRRARAIPSFTRIEVVHDYVAAPGSWRVIEKNPALAPAPTTIAPAVHQHSDSADKPAIWMPPPCTLELVVPEGEGEVVLRASAGVDRSVRRRLPKGSGAVSVDFEVSVDGESVFRERIVSERPAPGEWDPTEWVWRHVGGTDGLVLSGGDVVRLSTSIPAGDPGNELAAKDLRVGFGGCTLERRLEQTRTSATREAPNIVLVVMDTLRADRMSCYGYGRPTTPRLDRLAARGVLFENAQAASSWTWPSTASILTGLPADAHGVTRNEACTLDLSLSTLPEVLQRNGYTTGAFSCNPLIAPERYFHQGFESFDYRSTDFRMSDEVMPDVLRWLDANAPARFFLYLHLADPHTPHRPHPDDLARLGSKEPVDWPERGLDGLEPDSTLPRGGVNPEQDEYAQNLYDASVATGDRWMGVFLDHLERLGLTDRTIVLFTSDHGEELLGRGRVGHGHGLHGELVHVPLIVAGPNIPSGSRVDAVVSNRHVAPTLARMGGAEIVGMGDGRFLLDDIAEELAVFQTMKGHWGAERPVELYGLRVGDEVLHWKSDADPGIDDLVYFDLGSDPGEVYDLAAEKKARAAELWADLKLRLDAQRRYAPEHVAGVGAGGSQTLLNIGYAGHDDEDEEEDDDARKRDRPPIEDDGDPPGGG